MSFNPSYHLSRSQLLQNLTRQSPIVLVEKLMKEAQASGEPLTEYQRDALQGAVAVLHAKKGDWQEFSHIVKELTEKEVAYETILSAFTIAEQIFKEHKDTSGLKSAIACSVKILSQDQTWSDRGDELAGRCFGFREFGDSTCKQVDTFFKSFDLARSQHIPEGIERLSTLMTVDDWFGSPADGALFSGNYPNEIDELSLTIGFDGTRSDQIADALMDVHQNIIFLTMISPLEGMQAFEELIDVIGLLPVWSEMELGKRNELHDENTSPEEFYEESINLYGVLVDMASDFISRKKYPAALQTVESLVNILPNNNCINFIDCESLAKIHTGIDLILTQLKSLPVPNAEETANNFFKGTTDPLFFRRLDTPLSQQARILTFALTGWLQTKDRMQDASLADKPALSSHRQKQEHLLEQSLRAVLVDIDAFLNSDGIRNYLVKTEVGTVINSEADAMLLNDMAVLHHRLAEAHSFLGDELTSGMHYTKFKFSALTVLRRVGVVARDFESEQSTTLFLTYLEDLVDRGNLKEAQHLAKTFYDSLFLSCNIIDLSQASLDEDKSSLEIAEYASSFVKEQFMVICAEGGFLDIAKDVYEDLLFHESDPDRQFAYLLSLIKGLKIAKTPDA